MFAPLQLTFVVVVSLSCLTSAFSTLFVTEGAPEERKTEGTETRTQKAEGRNNVADNQVVVETIPFFTDVFNKVEDVMDLTPLKVATIISAQHLINTVKNIPTSGSLPQDNLNMLSNIVEEFNKTTQVIKLTAEYVNISSHYILNSLNQFAKDNCDEEKTRNTMKTINTNFLNVISNHVKVAVQEITEKTQHREMTGTDVLVSSAYHIVATFQEMTNQVLTLKVDDSKCNVPKTPPNSEQINIFENLSQDATHKSIKKDQALPKIITTNVDGVSNSFNINNIDQNPDLTIEIYPHEQLILNEKDQKHLATEKIQIPESLKVAFLSDEKIKSDTFNKQENIHQTESGMENTKSKENIQNFSKVFGVENVNPGKELAMDIFFPQKENKNNPASLSKINKNNLKNIENFNVYYYPLRTSDNNHNFLSEANDMHSEKQAKSSPFKTLSLFGNSDFGKNVKQQKKQYSAPNSRGSQTNLKNFDDTLTLENLNRQDLTVEVFSPEAFMHYGKDALSDSKKENINIQEIQPLYRAESILGNFKSKNLQKSQDLKRSNHKRRKIPSIDRELASSAVDSLSNVPQLSYDSGINSFRGGKPSAKKLSVKKSLSTVLMPLDKVTPQFTNPLFHKNQQKPGVCDERVEPVCGIDQNKSNFIIFLNDCQRKHHNNVYKTSYEWTNMDTCIGYLMKYSTGKETKNMKIIRK